MTVAKAVSRSVPDTLRAVGTVEASSSVEIRSQVSGELLKVHFKEGQDVAAGDVLFTIDPRTFELAVKQAEAQLAKDIGQSKTAELQRTRASELLQKGILAQSDFDTTAAQANALQGTIAEDRVQVDNARLQLQYATIRAPMAGRTGAFLVHAGALIRANDEAPMVVINRIAPVLISFALPARVLPRLGLHNKVPLQVTANPTGTTESPATGAVTFIDNTIDTSTDTIRLKATFSNGDRTLWPGQFVEVSLRLGIDENAVVIPSTAVQTGQQGTFVWVVNDENKVAVQQATVARTEGTDSIIASGVTAGQTVVTDGQLRLTPGAEVSIKPTAGTSTAIK